MYPVYEHFYSLQGEGRHSGMPAYFIRLAGCPVACPFCDSAEAWDGDKAPRLSAAELAQAVAASGAYYVVITGGEPLIHALDELCNQLRQILPPHGEIWLETSGTAPLSGTLDWICLSPKKHCLPLAPIYAHANEMKIIISDTSDFLFAEREAQKVGPSCHLLLQAEWDQENTMHPLIIEYILKNPRWSLSIQTHKLLHIL